MKNNRTLKPPLSFLIIAPVNIILCFVDENMNLFKIVLTLFYDLLGPVPNVAKYRRLEPGCSIALLADSQRSWAYEIASDVTEMVIITIILILSNSFTQSKEYMLWLLMSFPQLS